jgi:hypothetical protein
MDPTLLSPEEYAAQIAESLAAGQNPPGLTPGSSTAVPSASPASLVSPSNFLAPVTVPVPMAAPSVPPVAGTTEIDPMLGVVPVAPVPGPATPAAPAGATVVPGADKWGAPPAPQTGPSFGLTMPQIPGGVGPLGMFANTERNVGEQRAATTGLMDAESKKQEQVSATLLAQAKDKQDRDNSNAAALADINTQADKLRQDIIDTKIDPTRLWNSRSAGQQAASLIGIVLSGVGGGMTGHGGNLALDVINRAIDRDINAQTAELGKKENALSHLMQKYNNLGQAQQMLRISQGEVYKMNLDAQVARMDSGVLKQKGMLLSAQAGTALAQMKDQFAQQIGMLNYQMSMLGGVGGGTQAYGHGSGKNAAPPSKLGPDGMLEARAKDAEKRYYLPDGTPMLAVDSARAKDAADQMGALKAAQELLGRLAAGQYGPVETSRATDAARLELARVLGKGTISEGVLNDAANIIGGWKARLTPGVDPYSVARDVLHDRISAATTTASGVAIPLIREKGR